MKIHPIHKILLSLETIPVMLLLLLSLFLLGDSRVLFFVMLLLSILSIISLLYAMVVSVFKKNHHIDGKSVYLMHTGVVITVIGLLSFLAGSNFKSHSPNAPFGIFSFGLIAFIPYLHIMFIYNFFIQSKQSHHKDKCSYL